MGLVFKVASATFDNDKVFNSLTLPDRDGLIGEFILGGTQATTIRNRANPSSPASVIGSPTYSDNYATVLTSSAGSYGFDTGLVAASDCTVIAVSSRDKGIAINNNEFTIGTGSTGLWNDNATGAFSFNNGSNNGSTDQAAIAQTPPADDSTTMFFQCGAGSIGQVGKLYVGKSGVLVTDLGTATASTRGSGTFKIGGVNAAAFGGGGGTPKRIAYAAVFNRVLTADEVDAIYDQLVAYYANRGMSVN